MTTAYFDWINSLPAHQRDAHLDSRDHALSVARRRHRERLDAISLELASQDRPQSVENQNRSAQDEVPYHPAKEV